MLLITGAEIPNCRRRSVAFSEACVEFQFARRDSKGCDDWRTGGAVVSTMAGAEERVRRVSGSPGADGAEMVGVVVVEWEAGGAIRTDWDGG